jgi:translocation and assembly module TamB
LVLDQGSMRLAGSYGRELRLQSRIDSVDLTLINVFAPGLGIAGRATGSIDFVQAGSAFPRLDASLAIRNFTRTTAASVSRPLDVDLVARLAPGTGTLNAVMRTRGTVVGRVQAAVQPLGSGSWTERIAGAPLQGGIRYTGPADALFSLAGLADQSLSGPLGVAADFGGRVERPTLQGIVRGRNLTYANATYGTRLTNLAVQGRFTGERLQIDQLTAQAGGGTVTGNGYVSLAAASGYPANFDLSLNDARLADSDALRVTATGNVRLIKAANQSPVLTGTVRLPATRYQVIRQGAAEVPELTGVRFKPPRGRPTVSGDAPAQSAASGFGDVRLDLTIVAPGQLFVSGMGLESEWSADLRVTGTSQNPRIAGNIDLVRGTLGFAGRSFELQEGRIRFVGGGTSDATIALAATETIEDVDVTVNVAGAALDPRVTFSSSPGLPQDEIVSRILFGNSVGQLSALQAVQLAASLNTLRGSGGGLNPLGKLRQVAGIDRLRILGADDTSGRGTALAAGKYIGDDIYLEVVTDARGFTATQLEVTLSRSLSILSQAGGSNSTNVNVRYRKTY